MKNLKSVRLVLASLAIGLFAARASAVVVLPGGLVHAHGTNLAARPELDGVIVADVLRPFSVNNLAFDISGTLQDQVVRTTDGTLSFYTRIFGVQVVRSSGSVPGVRLPV
ncbi:MAG: hypothetical protein NTW19_08650 [Planctomycetota bacterium]|nr:hypothetical protein [Planctomycetota bacterium]